MALQQVEKIPVLRKHHGPHTPLPSGGEDDGILRLAEPDLPHRDGVTPERSREPRSYRRGELRIDEDEHPLAASGAEDGAIEPLAREPEASECRRERLHRAYADAAWNPVGHLLGHLLGGPEPVRRPRAGWGEASGRRVERRRDRATQRADLPLRLRAGRAPRLRSLRSNASISPMTSPALGLPRSVRRSLV